MARRSLKPQLNQIRAWVRQGRTDAWIAHQLEVSASELREFRKQHDLTPDEENGGGGEVDLRDEIEAEVEAATAEEAEQEDEEEPAEEDEGDEGDDEDAEAGEKPRERAPRARRTGEGGGGEGGGDRPRRRRRRGRRGGRGRRKELEATFDHGERDGYGLWLDPAVKDDPLYAERWAGKREVTVRIEADQIVIRRAGESAGGGSGDAGDSDE
jgi:hypothetical protein